MNKELMPLIEYKSSRIAPENLLLWFILSFPIADILTGFMIFRLGMPESFVGSPSQLIRVLFLFSGFAIIPSHSLRKCLILFFWLLIVESFSFFYVPIISPFLSGLNYSFKILYIYVFYLWSNYFCENKRDNFNRFQKTIFKSTTIYSLGIIVPSLLGIGSASYGEGTFGQKGLLASANALGIYLGIISVIYSLKKNLSYTEKLCVILFLTALILLATKTALLFVVLIVILFLSKSKKIYSIPILLIIVFGIIYYSDILLSAFSTVADVIIFRYEKSDSFFSFLMSSRDNYVSNAFVEFFKSPIWFIKAIIGGGAFMSFRPSYYPNISFDTLENEFFDIFFMYGLVGLSIYLGVIFYELYKIQKNSFFLAFLFFLFALHSVLAGHIVFDGIPILACLLVVQMSKHYNIAKSQFKI